jgi:type II secretory pathway pseudopilin PulG
MRPPLKRTSRLRRHGIFTLEAILGLALIIIIAAALGAVTDKQQRAAIVAADRRCALREVESALTLLQSGQPLPAKISIQRLDTPAPPGWTWVEATTKTGSRPTSLTGLIPIPGGDR